MVALVWGLDAARKGGNKHVPRCGRRCRQIDDDEILAGWGCSRAAEEPVWSDVCGRCEGEGCEDCGGTGELQHYRCPQRVVESYGKASRSVSNALQSYMQLSSRNVQPCAGGSSDQPISWWNFVQAVDASRGTWERAADSEGSDGE